MVDGDKEALHKKTARIQRLKASLKLHRLQPEARLRRLGRRGHPPARRACPGSTGTPALPKLDAEAQSVTVVDFDNDGKPDICLCGANKVVLLQNGGDGFIEVALPGLTGGARVGGVGRPQRRRPARPACSPPPTGPRLFTNLGKGQFRDDTQPPAEGSSRTT